MGTSRATAIGENIRVAIAIRQIGGFRFGIWAAHHFEETCKTRAIPYHYVCVKL